MCQLMVFLFQGILLYPVLEALSFKSQLSCCFSNFPVVFSKLLLKYFYFFNM
ncbi:hypothetical protein SAMN02745751_01832 [Dethiosulfatibacter aminovorans DSM 17477]|uniref:Uncharacterized protein n=1 Tax=Dethiosulfatibacter aminovorans DSM 17477 TaxID=1121476 RepID=A0A1M6GTH2_9FIRM|nr:hypothetical protein SAMN02745751_01832 [Dethiosulfatibacter aminovorans DSM 17477]